MRSASLTKAAFVPLALGSIAVGLAVLLGINTGSIPWGDIALFGVLFCIAGHQVVEIENGNFVSAGFIIAVATIIVLRSDAPLFGPLLVGMCGGIYWPQIRNRQWIKMFGNLGVMGLSALAGAAVYVAFPLSFVARAWGLVIAATVVTVACVLSNFVLIGLWLAADQQVESPNLSAIVRDFAAEVPQVFPFGLLGAFLGELYLDLGPIVLPLFIAPVLIARQSFASYMRLKNAQQETANILIAALEVKDRYTAGHVGRVARYAVMTGEELKFSQRRLERLHYAALMHDIGKLLVPNYLLNKPGKLTAEEFERVREHEDVSVELLEQIDFLAPVASSASGHFAKFSEGDESDHKRPIEPHIVHVADAYDAMTSTRAYRKALPHEVAVEELRKHAGTQFHPQCVEALLAALERKDEVHGAGHEDHVEEFAVAPPEAGTGSAGLGDLEPSAGDLPDTGVVA